MLIINQSEVRRLLPMRECIGVMAGAFSALARGEAILPLRPVLWLPDRVGALGMMPAYLAGIRTMGLKAVSVFPGNHGTEYDSHQGAVLLFETAHGQLLAVIDASEITAIRTAAVTGLATRLLAREDAGDIAILGSGIQARTHLEAMLAVRAARRVRVWSRNPDHAREFAARESERLAVAVEPAASAEEAVAGADLVCTTTSATEPILEGRWLAPGAHVNAVGSSVPFARELDAAAVARSRLFVDRRESTVAEAGDFVLAKADGAVDDDHIQGEIGNLLLGRLPGRTAPEQITLFKSVGLAIEDLAAAHYIYEQAQIQGVGLTVDFGGTRR